MLKARLDGGQRGVKVGGDWGTETTREAGEERERERE